ncbi:MAG: hypothetical protein ABI831_26550 [Betaproteobacteria bacterium]
MVFRIIAGIVAALLLLLFISPVVLKLKDVALSAVVLVGITMMIIDAWQSRKAKND